jgi:hypothetical protein
MDGHLLRSFLLATMSASASPAEPCEVVGVTAAVSDVELARAACDAARARFAELFGAPAPPARVELRDAAGYRTGVQAGVAVVRWPVSAAMTAPGAAGALSPRQIAQQWSDVLPHEIAHALLVVRAYPDGFPPHDGYGTPLPDWFEEAVAIWAEPPASRDGRVAQARTLNPRQQDLRTITEGAHPALANRAAFAARDGAALPADSALWAFYPQSAAVLAFVFESGGPAAVTELKRRLLAGHPPYAALTALPDLPPDTAALESAWQRFLRAPARTP